MRQSHPFNGLLMLRNKLQVQQNTYLLGGGFSSEKAGLRTEGRLGGSKGNSGRDESKKSGSRKLHGGVFVVVY